MNSPIFLLSPTHFYINSIPTTRMHHIPVNYIYPHILFLFFLLHFLRTLHNVLHLRHFILHSISLSSISHISHHRTTIWHPQIHKHYFSPNPICVFIFYTNSFSPQLNTSISILYDNTICWDLALCISFRSYTIQSKNLNNTIRISHYSI